VAGGFGIEDMPTNVEQYDPTTGIWTSTIPLITSRRGHSGLPVGRWQGRHRGWVNFNAGGASANAELYDPAAAVPAPLLLTDAVRLPSGAFQFGFNNTPGLNFSVFSAPDPTMTDGAWVNLGQPTEVLVGTYEFTDSSAANRSRSFYRVRAP